MAAAPKILRAPVTMVLIVTALLAGWMLWTGGLFDSKVIRDIRNSAVSIGSSWDLDRAEAESVIGDRRLVVAFVDGGKPEAREECRASEGAADGLIFVSVYRDVSELDSYSCAWFEGYDDKNFGKAVVAENQISAGFDSFIDRPLDALRVIVVQYDQLVSMEMIPPGGREYARSAPRLLLGLAAALAVLLGTPLLWWASRRAGAVASDQTIARQRMADRLSQVNARLSGVAAQILELDAIASPAASPPPDQEISDRYLKLTEDYVALSTEIAETDGPTDKDVADWENRITKLKTAASRVRRDLDRSGAR